MVGWTTCTKSADTEHVAWESGKTRHTHNKAADSRKMTMAMMREGSEVGWELGTQGQTWPEAGY